MLAGRNVVLGVCGSIAAVRCVELVHELRRQGAEVRAVATAASSSIVHPWSLQFATERPVVTEITGEVEHVALCGSEGWGDVLLIAPATANTLGKGANAIDDTPVTTCLTTALGADVPVVVAPAMHEPMWDHPGVLDSIEQLESWGVEFVPPRLEEGKAKIASDEAIVTAVARATTPQRLLDRDVVVTSGPTSESIDPVRVLTNRSSGRTGRAIAQASAILGANVTLIHQGPDVHYASVESIETGAEMRERAIQAVDDADALISAAAIGDFTVSAADEKLDSGQAHDIRLEPAQKLLDAVRDRRPDIPIVGFKAEPDANDDAMVAAARAQQERIGSTFVVANDAAVMGNEHTRVLIVDGDEVEEVEGTKPDVGFEIAGRLASELESSDE